VKRDGSRKNQRLLLKFIPFPTKEKAHNTCSNTMIMEKTPNKQTKPNKETNILKVHLELG
jgi:hypothetical protein